MQLARTAVTAALILAPYLAHATTYRLDAVYNGGPQDLGTVGIADSAVASGHIDLTRTCSAANVCGAVSPGWDQVTFNLAGHLQDAALGTGGAIDDAFHLTFDGQGNVSGGSILIEGDFAGTDTALLRGVALGGSGPTFSGVYIPSQPASIDSQVTLTFVQVGNAPALTQPVPEPNIGWSLLLAGFVGLPWLAGVRR